MDLSETQFQPGDLASIADIEIVRSEFRSILVRITSNIPNNFGQYEVELLQNVKLAYDNYDIGQKLRAQHNQLVPVQKNKQAKIFLRG